MHKITVLYNYTVQHIKMVHQMCKHLQNELLDSLFQNISITAYALFLRKPMGNAVNKINRGESVCTKQNNCSKRLVIVVIINQNKVIIIPLSRYPRLEDGNR